MKQIFSIAAATLISAAPALAEAPIPFDKALACVQGHVPASSYVTNDLVPSDADLADIKPLEEPVELRVGLSWVLNAEHAHLYNAIERGYFADEGIEVELVPGGPGKNHLQTLGGGAVDIAFAASGSNVPQALTSPTPINGLMVVGSVMKGEPGALMTIDPKLQDREITPEDLRGKTIAGGPFLRFLPILLDKAGMNESDVTVIKAGFSPDALFAGAADFYFGWVFNQTAIIEERGHDWNALLWRDHAFDNYPISIVVKQEMLDDATQADIAKRFVRAVYRGLSDVITDPEGSAEITVKHAVDAKDLTTDAVLFRFKEQEFLITNDGERLLETDPAKWDENAATLVQYGFFDTVPCE
ncbi:ABC transporter substrate-binding protein [uncultured Ruegeria sp.]|uniref:ABC transporter substrate-binding protein n=1 Tax=uncultured Ruegeria sp. TaxID=259304 RepID=UPI0026309F87|nr:ABC transporter substrate-binding protein [uncultured Ruegeria sp.]